MEAAKTNQVFRHEEIEGVKAEGFTSFEIPAGEIGKCASDCRQ